MNRPLVAFIRHTVTEPQQWRQRRGHRRTLSNYKRRAEFIAVICLDEIGVQAGVVFQGLLNIAVALDIADKVKKRFWPQTMKAPRQIGGPCPLVRSTDIGAIFSGHRRLQMFATCPEEDITRNRPSLKNIRTT
jgi:hypothetical protein